MGKLQNEYRCSLQLAIDILGGKWKMRIIWYLLDGTKRFSDFARKIPNISQKTLTQQLRELENKDIISRKIYAEMPPRVEYTLTEYGYQLSDVLKGLSNWSHQYAIDKDIPVSTRKKNNIKIDDSEEQIIDQ
jgi:DNA-binding HxlR family transcriptional regulator